MADLRQTLRTEAVLELAEREARELGHGYVGTEHLLLAILREGGGIAAAFLAAQGVTYARADEIVAMAEGTHPAEGGRE